MSCSLEVSVALCTYNGERFIDEQLASIFSQDPLPSELVVSDDASTDSTVRRVHQMIEERAPRSLRCTVIAGDVQLGVTANFQRAVTACSGDLVVLSDQDDVWHPDRLRRALREFECDPDLLFLNGDARLVDQDGVPLGHSLFDALRVRERELGRIDEGDAFSVLLKRNLATGAASAFRRSLVDRAVPFPAEWVHDEWLAIMAAAIGRLATDRSELIDYRQHSKNEIGARRATVLSLLSRLMEPSPGRYAALARRSVILADRLEALGVGAALIDAARGKARFESGRELLPENRVLRIPRIVRGLMSGDYARFASQGRVDTLRDLLHAR